MAFYYVGTGFVSGNNAAQNLVSIENPAGSGVLVVIQTGFVHGIPTGLIPSAGPFLYHLVRTTGAPSGGTTLTAATNDSANAAPAAIVRLGPTATATGGDVWSDSPGTSTLLIGASPPVTVFGDTTFTLKSGESALIHTDGASNYWKHWAYLAWFEQ